MPQELNALAERVLSKSISDGFCVFLTNVLRQALQYRQTDKAHPVFIVVITRRCYVLFFSYYEMLCKCIEDPNQVRPAPWKSCDLTELQEFKEIFEACVVTDNAAWSMAYDIVCGYQKTSVFPHLIVVDELLFHGRALNGFLYGFEKRLRHGEDLYQEKYKTTIIGRKPIQSEFLDKLTICVANRNVGSSVLLPRYQKILARDSSNVEIPIEMWRNHSIAYAQYVSVCGINNVGFTLGLSIPVQKDCPIVSCADSTFTKVCTRLQNIEQDTYLFFYPSAAQPRVICTVRCKQSQTEEKKNMYVPYLIVDHISREQLVELHYQLLQEAQESGKQKMAALLGRLDVTLPLKEDKEASLLVPWLTQTTDLILTSWLMKRFLREVKGVNREEIATIWKDSIGWGQLRGSFRSYSIVDETPDETLVALQELWNWEPAREFEEYLAVYAANAQPISVDWMDLCPIGDANNVIVNENSPLVLCLEDTIAKVGLEAERNAYTLYGSGLPFSDEALSNWGDNHSIDTLLEKLRIQTEIYASVQKRVNLYEVVAIIIQAMDLGVLGMNAILDRQPCIDRVRYESRPYELYTRQRAGEAALFLLPIRYRNLLPVLSEIQNKRREDLEGAFFDLMRFIDSIALDDPGQPIQITNDVFLPAAQLKRSLCSAYEMLVLGGQKLKEWQCNLHDRRLPTEKQEQVGEINRRLRTHFLRVYRNL